MSNKSANIAIISDKILNKIKHGLDIEFPTADSIVLTSKDLSEIKSKSKNVSHSGIHTIENINLTKRQERNKKAQLRKKRMLELEKNRRLKNQKTSDLTDVQKSKLKEQQKILKNAKTQILSNLAGVQQMNSLVLYAKCAAIRDRQLLEKSIIRKQEQQQNKTMDEMMEIDRINSIRIQNEKIYNDEQAIKASAKVIVQQMSENKTKKLLEQEKKRLEGIAMFERIAFLEKCEKEKQLKKMKIGHKLLMDIKAANIEAQKIRSDEKLRQKMEDDKIQQYLKDKDFREQERINKLKEISEQKEFEKMKICEQQEKVADHVREKEEIIIRRAQEENERRWRKKQLICAKQKNEMRGILHEARERSRLEKELRLAEQAAQERLEFEKNVNAYHEQQQEIENMTVLKLKNKKEYREMLQQQIHEKNNLLGNSQKINLRKEYQQRIEDEEEQLLKIKNEKIKELEKFGVPNKYMADLQKYKYQPF